MKRQVIYSPETHMDILYRWEKRGRGGDYMGPNHVQINWNHTKVNRKHKPSINQCSDWLMVDVMDQIIQSEAWLPIDLILF